MVDCYLAHNFGDDLFLITLASNFPKVQFQVIANQSYNFIERLCPNINILHCVNDKCLNLLKRLKNKRDELLIIHKADALVTIGGSLYIEKPSGCNPRLLIDKYRRYFRDVVRANNAKNYYVMGANFGPYSSKSFLRFYTRFFEKFCEDVCFRDRFSANQFSSVTNVRYAPDILFGAGLPNVSKRHQVFISVIDLQNCDHFGRLSEKCEAYEQMILEYIKRYADIEYKIILCSFFGSDGDSLAVKRISVKASEANISIQELYYTDNIEEILSEISMSEIVIGTRFHATVIGLAAGAAVVPIIYSTKTLHVLDDLGFNRRNTIDLSSDEWLSLDLNTLPDPLTFNVDREKALSKCQFSALSKFIESSE
ncbi:polysaccharide pyruvyl transferase family protein [Collinsella tanakaei]|uniref:polysaccharide pyruvyl transferase family protein n=1 Tax=Collinsella tanakaei TaxID=626935 RepID=UPI00195A1CC4|nr:polysaccharide pyruvyl transferase family protein [Collinsella tanakaei]MBM6868107.1 polysaccharide pyruvyl transferase family protein [Collinsella tanakaei]